MTKRVNDTCIATSKTRGKTGYALEEEVKI